MSRPRPLGDHPSFQIALLIFILIGLLDQTASWSQSPHRVQFDVPVSVNCRDVTNEQFSSTHSQDKLLEIRMQVSSLFQNSTDQHFEEIFFLIHSPEKSIRVVDFAPQTSVQSEYASPIEVSRNKEDSKTAGFQFTPNLEWITKSSLNANFSDRTGETTKTTKLPPKKLAVASGSQSRQTAVYFKFKPNNQSSLEGVQQLTLIVQVPLTWRADLLHVHCRAKPCKSNVQNLCQSDFIVPIHIENDAAAKGICDLYINAENQLRKTAQAEQLSKIEEKKDLLDRLESLIAFKNERHGHKKMESEKLPANWLGKIIFSQSVDSFADQLSQPTRKATQQFLVAREAVIELND